MLEPSFGDTQIPFLPKAKNLEDELRPLKNNIFHRKTIFHEAWIRACGE